MTSVTVGANKNKIIYETTFVTCLFLTSQKNTYNVICCTKINTTTKKELSATFQSLKITLHLSHAFHKTKCLHSFRINLFLAYHHLIVLKSVRIFPSHKPWLQPMKGPRLPSVLLLGPFLRLVSPQGRKGSWVGLGES